VSPATLQGFEGESADVDAAERIAVFRAVPLEAIDAFAEVVHATLDDQDRVVGTDVFDV